MNHMAILSDSSEEDILVKSTKKLPSIMSNSDTLNIINDIFKFY